MAASLLRLLSASAALAIGGALLPALTASAAPDPAETTELAAAACASAMLDRRLDDATVRLMKLRREAWGEVASGAISGRWAESGWSATSEQVAALQVAVAWMDQERVAELADADDDTRQSAEDDLVWAVRHLTDDDLADVLRLPLDERTAVIARYRHGAHTTTRTGTGSTRAREPAAAEPAAAEPDTAEPDTADARPDVPVDALREFQDRAAKARDLLPDEARKALEEQRGSGLVHAFGATSALLEWTIQQGDRGVELIRSWSEDAATSAADLRSIVEGTPAADPYGAVLDACVGALVIGAGDEGLDRDRAAELAEQDIAGRLQDDGTIREVPADAPGSAHLLACAAAVAGRARELGLDDDGLALVASTDASAALDDAWRADGVDAGADGEKVAEVTIRFWVDHNQDDAVRRWIEGVAAGGFAIAAKALDRCLSEVPKLAEERREVDADFVARSADASVARFVDEMSPTVDQPAEPAPAEPAPSDPAPAPTSSDATPAPLPTATEPAPAPSSAPDPTVTARPSPSAPAPIESEAPAPSTSPAPAPSTSPAPAQTDPIADDDIDRIPVSTAPIDRAPATTPEPSAAPVAATPSRVTTGVERPSGVAVAASPAPTSTTPSEDQPTIDATPVVDAAQSSGTSGPHAAAVSTPAHSALPPIGVLAFAVPLALGGVVVTAGIAFRRR